MKNLLKKVFMQLVMYGFLAISTIGVFFPLLKLEHLKSLAEPSPLNNIILLGLVAIIGIAIPQLILIIMSYLNRAKRSQYQSWQYRLAMVIIICRMFFSVPSNGQLNIDQIDAMLSIIFGFMFLQYIVLAVYFIVTLGRKFSRKISKEDITLSNIPAGFWDRIWAKCIDIGPILLAGTILMVILASFLPVWIILCLMFGLFGQRYIKSLVSKKQATRGKKSAGIYVAQWESLNPITKPQALARYVVVYLPLLALLLAESSTLDASIH